MHDQRNSRFIAAALLALALAGLACNLPGGGAATEESTAVPTELIEAIPTPTITPIPDPLAACPQPGEGTSLLVNREDGFCFLYPSNYVEGEGVQGRRATFIAGPPLDPNSIEPVAVFANVEYTGPGEGLTARSYAQRTLDLYYRNMGLTIEDGTMGGLAVAIVHNVPGMMGGREAYIVTEGARYKITLSPEPGQIAELDQQAEQTWQTITSSIVFFTP